MRPRFAMLCVALSGFALVATPGLASAAPKHNHGLTINATPNPIQAGEGVLIYGQLNGTDITGKTIALYHHISDSGLKYSLIGQTTTDSHGFYEFTREEGVVLTNRSWFVRLSDNPKVHSRTIHEHVSALVSISASSTNATTRHRITFTGEVTPSHAGRVELQEQRGTSDDWRTLKVGHVGADGHYSLSHSWAIPGAHVVRVISTRNDQNLRGVSDTVTVTIQQAQRPGFTINTTTPVISYLSSATITGTLSQGTSTTPSANTPITLCERTADQAQATCNTAGTTGTDGSYSFTVMPVKNTLYFVRVTQQPKDRTASLFVGVKDNITLTASSTGTVGQGDTFSGTVTPDKTGHVVYLQRKERDGEFHNVGVTRVNADGTYSITHVFGTAGTKLFRTRIPGGEVNLGDVSAPVTVTVAQASTVSTLPTAS